MSYIASIGLEVHVQLRTRSKMFCGCRTDFGAAPNTHVCPVCLGYPGALPVMNEEAIRLTVMAGLMLGCDIGRHSKFDRKSYFYPDMPKNFQITQYDMPLCAGGGVRIETDGKPETIRLRRIHLEEDVGKSMHFARSSGVDFNRAGIPLMEIVTYPDISSPEQAFAFLLALKQILTYAGVSDCNLEQGNLRCDVNCSVRPAGQEALGTKTEIKNLNTFKGIFNALKHEIARQTEVLESGGEIRQETRRWDSDTGATVEMRAKESAHDYRYFAEPDLMPVALSAARIQELAAGLPELPRRRRERFVKQYGLPEYDANVLAADKAVADYYEASAACSDNPKAISNWVMTEMLRLLSGKEMEIKDARISPRALADLARLVADGAINSTTAKEIFAVLFEHGGDPCEIVKSRGLAQVSDSSLVEEIVGRVIAQNPDPVQDYRRGKKAAIQFLLGQVMRTTGGKTNPQTAREILLERLDKQD